MVRHALHVHVTACIVSGGNLRNVHAHTYSFVDESAWRMTLESNACTLHCADSACRDSIMEAEGVLMFCKQLSAHVMCHMPSGHPK